MQKTMLVLVVLVAALAVADPALADDAGDEGGTPCLKTSINPVGVVIDPGCIWAILDDLPP